VAFGGQFAAAGPAAGTYRSNVYDDNDDRLLHGRGTGAQQQRRHSGVRREIAGSAAIASSVALTAGVGG